MAHTLNFNELPDKFFETLETELSGAGATPERIAEVVEKLLTSFHAAHEKTLDAIGTPEAFRAFVEQLTKGDLLAEDITEESIDAFFASPIEAREQAIRNLDVLTVCSLYERMTSSKTSKGITTDQVKKGLIEQFRAPTEALCWVKKNTASHSVEVLELKRNNRQIKSLVEQALAELYRTEGSNKE